MKRPRKLKIGSRLSGTLRIEDLIQAGFAVTDEVVMTWLHRKKVNELRDRWAAIPPTMMPQHQESATHIWSELCDIINEYAPEFTYFGANEGDGADFGVWPDEIALSHAEICGDLCRGAQLPVPNNNAAAYFLKVTDHGNMTLYRRGEGIRWFEEWSIV